MDQRITQVSNLKSQYSKRNSINYNFPPKEEEQKQCWQDIEYMLARNDVLESQFFQQANKHIRIRLVNWIEMLEKIRINKVWKNNRNHYIKLMKLMCQCEYLTFPFNALPTSQDLPTLKKHQINLIIDEVEREVKALKFTNRKMSSVFDSQGTISPKWCSFNGSNQISTPKKQSNKLKTFESVSFGEQQSNTRHLKSININKRSVIESEGDYEQKIAQMRGFQYKGYNYSPYSKASINFQDDNKTGPKIDQMQMKLRKNSLQLKQSKTVLSETTNQSRSSLQNTKLKSCAEGENIQKKVNQSGSKPPICQKNKRKNLQKIQTSFKKKKDEKQNEYFAEKQYWMSNSGTCNNTGTGTPKYFQFCQAQPSLNIQESVEMISFRSQEGEPCECTNNMLGDNWFSSWFSTQQ